MSYPTPDSIIMGEIVKIVMSPTENEGIKSFANAIIPKIPAIICMIAIKKCIENASDFVYNALDAFKALFRKLFYTQVVLNEEDDSYLYLKKNYEKENKVFSNQLIPIYWSKSTPEECAAVSYISWFPLHRQVVEAIQKKSQKEKETNDEIRDLKKSVYKKLNTGLKYENSVASKLYPSRNFTKLVNKIKSYITVSKKTESYSVLGVLIDGVPGLGKTKFADFSYNERVVNGVYKVDMTTMLQQPFDKVLKAMYHQVEIIHDTMFVIDEIDKYIHYRLDVQYSELKASSKSKESSDIPSFDEYTSLTKNTFLYDMLSILERDGLSHPVIVVFCSNNFASIFEGVDILHHKSLYDRFLKVKFTECDYCEIIDYMKFYNQKLEGCDNYCEWNSDLIESSLRKDVKITYRSLYHIAIANEYNVYSIINAVNKHVNEDDSGEGLEEKINKIRKSHKLPVCEKLERSTIASILPNVSSKQIIKEFHEESSSESVIETDDEENDTGEAEIEDEVDSEEKISNEKKKIEEEVKSDLLMQCSEKNGLDSYELNYLLKPYEGDFPEMCREIKRENDNILSLLEPHQLLWNEKYKYTGPIENYLRTDIMDSIRKYLNECEAACTKENKLNVVVKMFDFLAEEGYKILHSNPKLRRTIRNKIMELSEKDDRFVKRVKISTLEFMYALTGNKW